MRFPFTQRQIAVAAVAALGAAVFGGAPSTAAAGAKAKKPAGTYVTGDFHNHTTCSDGSISMQKLVKKSTDASPGNFGLDWFVQAGHGGSGNRNCTLAEDESLATPAYPLVTSTTGALQGPSTTWQNTNPPVQPKGLQSGTPPNQNMWRWQSIQEFQYPITEYLAALKDRPLFVGVETVVPGHEHTSMSVITGQMPAALDNATLPTGPGYTPLGNATALAQWEYCFDRNDGDTSRGNTAVGGATGNNWNCSVPGSANAADPSWNATAQKLMPAGGAGAGHRGHAKTVEAVKWMAANHPTGSYYVPAHLERAGPFNPDGNNGFNIEHLRNLNNAAPNVAFGFESQPGHGASDARGEYTVLRNTIAGVRVDSAGGTTYGGTGVYAAQVGGVWDALLGEGRNWWFFASSDWHNRGIFGPDDRRSSQDFLPGEYQRTAVMVRNGSDKKLRPQTIVDGLRTGNAFASSGQLIDRLAFVACASYPTAAAAGNTNAPVEAIAFAAAVNNTDVDREGCATMGEKLVVKPGQDVVVSIVARDPAGKNSAPYSFANPSLAQIGVSQPLDQPVLDHIDVIGGVVSGYKQPGSAGYAGEWPRNTAWLRSDGSTAGLAAVPAAAKNESARIVKTFNATTWKAKGEDFVQMSFRIPAVAASQYIRLRGSNLPAGVPYETDANGNPLSDIFTNAIDTTKLRIPCTVVGSNVPSNAVTYTGTGIDGCPNHLPVVGGQKYVAFDVAAWADLWFYSNPIYIEVQGGTTVAGVK